MNCAHLFYSLQIHPSLAQEVTGLDIKRFPSGFNGITPDLVNDVQPSAYTPDNTPLEVGALRSRLQWTLECHLSEAEYLQLKALYSWQQRQKRAGLDARLQWTDRYEPSNPEPAGSLTRDIIDPKVTGDGLTYGFPVVSCNITYPSGQIIGRSSSGDVTRLCAFVVTERAR